MQYYNAVTGGNAFANANAKLMLSFKLYQTDINYYFFVLSFQIRTRG
jgi:hypothetical protein